MTDARIPERWLNDRRIQRSDAHFRSFINALLWAVANRTDGEIQTHELAMIPGFTLGLETEFVSSGVWITTGTGWRITEFESTQTSRDELEALEQIRAGARKRKAKQRAETSTTGQTGVTGQSRDMSRDMGRDKSAMSRDLHRQAGRQAGLGKEPNYVSGNGEKNSGWDFPVEAPMTDPDGFPLDDVELSR